MLIAPSIIPRVTPIYIGKSKDSGRTTPLEMHCSTPNGNEDYIVKLWANPQLYLGRQSLTNEVYGSLLAKAFGISTPDISIVDIPEDFYESSPQPLAERLRSSSGLNFGSKYIPGAIIFSPPVPPSKQACAVRVFCFDLLICNVDRNIRKPNTFQTADEFIVFDHEQAFPYCRPQMIVGGLRRPWEHMMEPWVRNHIFYPDIRNAGSLPEIESFIENLGYLSEEFLDTIDEQIPEEWRSDSDLENIRHFLLESQQNLDQLKRTIQEILV